MITRLFGRACMHFLDAELDLEFVGEADAGVPEISLARELRPDVVVTDLLLPDLDGSP